MKEIIGILGGLGPETTNHFNTDYIETCLKYNPAQRPPMLNWFVDIDTRMEKKFVEEGIGGENYIPFLVEGANRLERAGSSFIVIPCNSVHIYIDLVRKSVNIPVLSIVEETTKFLKDTGREKVGLIATPITVSSGLYHKPLRDQGIDVVLPNNKDQSLLGQIIERLVSNKFGQEARHEVMRIMENLTDQGVDSLLLACTDFQLLDLSHPNLPIYDTMHILAEAAAKRTNGSNNH